MSAPATQVGNHTGISDEEWVVLFPKHVTEYNISSLIFLKQLTVVAISTISYLKDAFPEENYSNNPLAGLNLKMLKDKSEDALVQFVTSSLKQAFEAIDKKFVQQLALCFYNGDCVAENLIEYHIFEYSYNSDGVTLSINSKNKKAMRCSLESVKTQTVLLIRSIAVFIFQNSQRELPVKYGVSLRLYYTEDCPENYQAPGFGPTIGPDHLAPTMSKAVCHGWVETPYHKFIARSFLRDVLVDSDDAASSDCTGQPEKTQSEHKDFQAELPPSPASASAPRVRCPCRTKDAQGQELLVCKYCHTRQHAVCFGLLAPAHCCAACAVHDPTRMPTCSWLTGLRARRQEAICVFQRTLVLCSQTAAVSGAQLQAQFRLSPTHTAKLLQLLAACYIIPEYDYADLEMPREINRLQLKLIWKQFFRTDYEQDDTADRVMMEEGPGDVDSPASNIPGFNADLVQLVELICGSLNKTMANNDVLEEMPLNGSLDPVEEAPTMKLKRKIDEQKPKRLARLRSGCKSMKNI